MFEKFAGGPTERYYSTIKELFKEAWRQHGDAVSARHERPGPGGVIPRRTASRIPAGKARRMRRRNFRNPVMRATGDD